MSLTPILKDFIDEEDVFKFQISNIDVCFVNAIRRTILSDIDVCCIEFESNKQDNNNINITLNTGRLHNEILKQNKRKEKKGKENKTKQNKKKEKKRKKRKERKRVEIK